MGSDLLEKNDEQKQTNEEKSATPETPRAGGWAERNFTLKTPALAGIVLAGMIAGAGIVGLATYWKGAPAEAAQESNTYVADIKSVAPDIGIRPDTILNQSTTSGEPDPQAADPFDAFFSRPFDPNTWDPFQEMEEMQRRMDALFNRSFTRFNMSPLFPFHSQDLSVMPRLDMRETDEAYVIALDMPGLEESSVDVTLENQTLRITGNRTEEMENQTGNVVHRERRTGRFQRSIMLDEPVVVTDMKTDYKDGVLTVTIPKEK